MHVEIISIISRLDSVLTLLLL